MRKPRTMAEYANLVEEALVEVDEMRHIIEHETEGAVSSDFLDPVEADLIRLKDAMATDTYDFRDEDLPFMSAILGKRLEQLPFRDLLEVINWTHRSGLETDE